MKATRGHIPWSNVDRRLRSMREIWIATSSPKGRPDAVPVWFWWDGEIAYFTCKAGTAKPRNIALQSDPMLPTAMRPAQSSRTVCTRVSYPRRAEARGMSKRTTALPKAAAFTQRACVATGIGVARSWELVPGDTYQSSGPSGMYLIESNRSVCGAFFKKL